MADHYVLVHAPVLGPASWEPAAAELRRLTGAPVTVPSLKGFTEGGPPYATRLARLCAAQVSAAQVSAAQVSATGDRVVIVVHSGAGPLAGLLVQEVARQREVAQDLGGAGRAAGAGGAHGGGAGGAGGVGVVFVDAGVPGVEGVTPVVGAGFLGYLREIARGGVVPPWHEWWTEADLAEDFSRAAVREAVLADARGVPLEFFEESVGAGRWVGAGGYLLFSAGYRDALDEARRRGWAVSELPGGHLHMLAEPGRVAGAIAELAGRLGGGSGGDAAAGAAAGD